MNNGKRQELVLPQMGWNSYCTVNCDPTEEIIIDNVNALIDKGLKDAGYTYVNLDDGWLMPDRDKNGNLVENRRNFPHGIKYLVDYIHSKGLKAGAYLGCGRTTYHGDAGTLGHEFEDAKALANWGFDYLKYDRRPMDGDPPRDTIKEYVKMGVALRDCGRDIFYSMCEHGVSEPWKWASCVGQSWRIGGDIRDRWAEGPECWGIMISVDYGVLRAAPNSRLGNYNDPDMLVVGMNHQNDWMGEGCTDTEYMSQFALWCMLPAPLLIGADLRRIGDAGVSILKHKGLIEINQDALGHPAERVRYEDKVFDVWMRPLSGIRWAVGLFNRSDSVQELSFTWQDMRLSADIDMKVKEVISGEDLGVHKGSLSAVLQAHEMKVFICEPSF